MRCFRLPSTSRWLLALAAVFICLIPAFAGAAGHAAGTAAPISIDISSLTGFLDTLPPDEKDEQLRDWAAYGLRNALFPAKAGELPVRHPAVESGRHGEVSPGRTVSISGKAWAIVAPPELLLDKPRVGGLVDRKYEETGRLPERISLFSYRYDASSALLTVQHVETVDPKRFFTPEYGYLTRAVSSLADLTGFLNGIDDLVGFSWRSGRLTLSGRKYLPGNKRALTVEDVAALYQAYNPPPVKKSQGPGRLRRRVSHTEATGQVGFSLDPDYDFAALTRELRIFAAELPGGRLAADTSHGGAVRGMHADIDSVAARIERRHDLRPLLALERRYMNSESPAERSVGGYLRNLQRNCAFQTARYDGNLQGTTVGMTLFYTDLLAKLWALDYQGIAPKGTVQGFRTMGDIAVPRLHWDNFLRLSQTRLWFGLRSEGFDVYGDKLLFQPAVTRVYAASSDPMYPGRESKPNFQSDAFLGWWDRHYETVAAAEPYYYKLDQIQKWSCVLIILKEKRSRLLDFLRGYPVRRNLDFESWSGTEGVTAGLKLAFLDRAKLGRRTECLPLLASRDYPLMGQQFVLTGGVSLASRKDILSKLRGHGKGRDLAAAPGDTDGESGTGGASPGARRAAKGEAGAKRIRGGNAGEKVAKTADDPAAPAVRKGLPQAGTAGDGDGKPDARGSDAMIAATAPVRMKLTWKKGAKVAAHDLVNALAAKQQKEGRHGDTAFEGLAGVHKVVRLREGVYLVKTDADGESWVYVEVNPQRTEGFPAKASAARPDADIFCAKAVSDSYIERLTKAHGGM